MKTSRRRWILGTVIALATAAVIVAAWFIWWGLTPLGPTSSALAALQTDADVVVSKTDAGWAFAPASRDATAGLIFYPGGHVDARSYAPYARDVAKKGYLAVVPVVPLSLAVLSPNAADDVIKAYPSIRRWALGGHSLGGVVASEYAAEHQEDVRGLVLLASYPSGGTDLADADIDVATLVGSQDTVVDMQTWEDSKSRLPSAAWINVLGGGNHSQFGDYGTQPGDTPNPTMSAGQQRVTAVQATVLALQGQ